MEALLGVAVGLLRCGFWCCLGEKYVRDDGIIMKCDFYLPYCLLIDNLTYICTLAYPK